MVKKFFIFFSVLIAFTLFFVSSSSYAATDMPPLPELPEQNHVYFIGQRTMDYKTVLYVFYGDFSIEQSKFYKSHNLSFSLLFKNSNNESVPVKYDLYILKDNTWSFSTTTEHTTSNPISLSWKDSVAEGLWYTSVDIRESENSSTIFFPVTPIPTYQAPTVAEMVAEETPKMAEKIIQAMKIIALCGVGCLAFLTALPILSRILRVFQAK